MSRGRLRPVTIRCSTICGCCAASVSGVSRIAKRRDLINSRTWPFSALRSVKDHPHQKIVREILEAMRQARGGEEKIIGLERIAAIAVYERASPPDHHITFVARVRLLRILSARCVKLHGQCPVLEDES